MEKDLLRANEPSFKQPVSEFQGCIIRGAIIKLLLHSDLKNWKDPIDSRIEEKASDCDAEVTCRDSKIFEVGASFPYFSVF